MRQELGMPPYTHLIKVVVSGRFEKEVVKQILGFSKMLTSLSGERMFQVLGPAPCLISKERGLFRWNLFFKGPSIEQMIPILKKAVAGFKKVKTTFAFDVDPQ